MSLLDDLKQLYDDYMNREDEGGESAMYYAELHPKIKERLEYLDRLHAQFVKHRTATHKVAPDVCETCLESDAILNEVQA